METVEEIYDVINSRSGKVWNKKEIAIMVAKVYAQAVAEDLRKRIIQEAFDDPYDIRRYANSIRNVEIITP